MLESATIFFYLLCLEDLGLNDQVVHVVDLLLDTCDIFAREARHDAVHEGCAHVVVQFKPFLELLVVLAEIVFPQLDILADALLQMVSVQENQLARHDDEAFLRVAAESLEAAVEQLCQFARIARCGRVAQFAGRVERDARLGGVGDDETDLGLVCQSHERCVLCVRVQRAADHVDTVHAVHGLAVLTTLQVHVVQAILAVQPFCHTFLDRLNHYNAAVEAGLLVHVPYDPIHECAEEIAFI